MSGKELRFDVAGNVIAALELGDPDGVPVIALHGWLDNAASFRLLAERLAGVRLIAVDLIGHGFSDHRPESTPYYIWDNVADVIGLMDELGLESANVIGHSMGASIASLLAGAYPERVKRLCLIEGVAPLIYEPNQLPQLMAEAIDKRSKARRRRLRPYESEEKAVQARVNGRWPVSEQAAKWLVERGVIHREDGVHWRNDAKLTLPSILRMSEDQVRAFLSRIQCKVELVLGQNGIGQDLILERIDCFVDSDVEWLEGNHHLHLQDFGAGQIAKRINRWAG